MPEKLTASQEIMPRETEAAEFPLADDPAGVLALFDERLADGGGLPILDLPRIRVAAGSTLAFDIESAAGNQLEKKVEGIIVAYRQARVYWRSRNAAKKPPDCTSIDGFIGIGDPGGECGQCPYARFGSGFRADGSPSNGQACKDIRQLLILLKGELLPHLLNVPPTSVKAFGQYTLTLLSARARYWGATTELTLEKAQSDDGIGYSKIVFRLGRRQPDLRAFEAFHQRMRSVLKPAVIDASSYEILDDAPPGAAAPASGPRRIAPNVVADPVVMTPGPDGPVFRPAGDDDVPF